MSEAVLRLRGVSKRYGTRAALTGLDLALRRGEVMGLLGPNGSGKSTALRIAAGVIGCDAGRVERGESRATLEVLGDWRSQKRINLARDGAQTLP